ncbi:MAG: 1,4-dihydroxy-6-naphthoate synthase [Bacteroidales bacterium]|jgi:1,4-dihydroxy-6-naphthoate synthase|nr:1,4-dihydroxy-6-naphthoate synthase [Bacteroidales bacterium]
METISLGFSPCPNDTFIFDALIHHKIDTKGIQFKTHIADVEELNNMARGEILDCTKISFHAFSKIYSQYSILDSGSALGFANGPLFICKKNSISSLNTNSIIALPGEHTTAHLLFSIAFPEYTNKTYMLFSDIEDAIETGKVDAGVIIHENRFTYAERGFEAVCDLGNYWEELTHTPIPLGAIAIHKRVPPATAQTVNTLIRESIEYAREHTESAMPFIQTHAQDLSPEIISKHIELFVNDFSIHLQDSGKQAIRTLFTKAAESGIISPIPSESVFLNS